MDLGQAKAASSPPEAGQLSETGGGPATTADVSSSSFDDDFQLSSSAPAILMSSYFGQKPLVAALSPMAHATTSPTASTLRLCQDMDKASASVSSSAQRKATSSSCGQLSMPASAPVLTDNPFRFTVLSVGSSASSSGGFVSCFEPIKEQVTPTTEDIKTSQPEPQVAYNLPTLLITDTASTTKSTSIKSSNKVKQVVASTFSPIESEISKDIGIETVNVTTFAPTSISTDIRTDTKTDIKIDSTVYTITYKNAPTLQISNISLRTCLTVNWKLDPTIVPH